MITERSLDFSQRYAAKELFAAADEHAERIPVNQLLDVDDVESIMRANPRLAVPGPAWDGHIVAIFDQGRAMLVLDPGPMSERDAWACVATHLARRARQAVAALRRAADILR